MNYSAIFSDAHKQAKALMTTGLFASYRGAFSVALSSTLRAAWAAHKEEKKQGDSVKAQKCELIKKTTQKKWDTQPVDNKRPASGRGLIGGKRVARVRRLGILSAQNPYFKGDHVLH